MIKGLTLIYSVLQNKTIAEFCVSARPLFVRIIKKTYSNVEFICGFSATIVAKQHHLVVNSEYKKFVDSAPLSVQNNNNNINK